MIVLPLVNIFLTDGRYANSFYVATKMINNFVMLPGAIGSIITGFLFGLLTNWGFFKFRWITVKWILTLTAILIGAIWLGPWIGDLIKLSAKKGFIPSENPTFLLYEQKFLALHIFQTIIIMSMIYISVFKPWKSAAKK